MPHTLNLDSYLARIGYGETVAANLDVLRALALHHAQTIPFEDLSPFLGSPVSLDLADIEDKLVRQRRGGYCFEQNLLFGHALRCIGFKVTDLAARVLWGRPDDAQTARTHMLLAVDLNGAQYVVDVGFGSQTLTGVLRLRANILQATPHGDFRLVHDDALWRMQSRVAGQWRSLYCFDLSPQYLADFEISNYYLSTHPDSHFTQNLIAAIPTPRARVALQNRDYVIHVLGGDTIQRRLQTSREIMQVLTEDFGIELPDTPALHQRLETLP
jgi:N-hydroxyarylamine O-acetyltransferase